MPNCFQLFRKGEKVATSLHLIDEELCKMLDEPVDPKLYVANWFDTIGLVLACKGFKIDSQEMKDWMLKHFVGPHSDGKLMKCLDYLAQNFTSDAWAEIGKR